MEGKGEWKVRWVSGSSVERELGGLDTARMDGYKEVLVERCGHGGATMDGYRVSGEMWVWCGGGWKRRAIVGACGARWR